MRSVLPLSTEPSLSSPPHRAPPLSTRLHSTPLGLHSGRVGWHTTHCHLCCNLSQNVPFSNSAPLTAPHLTTPLDSTRVITITGINWALIPKCVCLPTAHYYGCCSLLQTNSGGNWAPLGFVLGNSGGLCVCVSSAHKPTTSRSAATDCRHT